MATIPEALAIAIQRHKGGQLDAAETLYRRILAAEPDHPDALHYLGVISLQRGDAAGAVDFMRRSLLRKPEAAGFHRNLAGAYRDLGKTAEAMFHWRRAIELKPNDVESLAALAHALRIRGDLDGAIGCYIRIAETRPDDADAFGNLANALSLAGRFAEAIGCYERAYSLRPEDAGTVYNLGVAFKMQGRTDEAVAFYRRAIELDPGRFDAYYNLGLALKEQGNANEAAACFRRAIEQNPNFAEAHASLAASFHDEGNHDDAVGHYRRALELKPDFAVAYGNLGAALSALGHLDDALACFRRAVELMPDNPEAHNNLGNALSVQRNVGEAIDAWTQAQKLSPNYPEARANLALAYLLQGDFARGWDEYEWRWKTQEAKARVRDFPQPAWDGGPLDGRTILLYAEQGLGDTLQFIRFVAAVARLGGKIVVECQPELLRVLGKAIAPHAIVAQGQPLPAFDVHCPLMSLPRVLGTTPATIPPPTPLIAAEASDTKHWQGRLAGNASLKVGLAWAGSKAHRNDRNRSLTLSALSPLAGVPGISFYSLQKGDAAVQAIAPPDGMNLVDWTNELRDFADTASLIANLDLVISVDTSVVHLAGSMGKPVWTLVTFAPDWRWQLDRDDTPWYPSMRLFRQPRIGDWESAIERVAAALAEFRDGKSTSLTKSQ